MSGAELARRLTAKLGRSIDRAAVQKMQMTVATKRTKPRAVKADEMMAIAEITGYPAPDIDDVQVTRVPIVSWVSAGQLTEQDGVPDLAGLPSITIVGLPPGDWIALTVDGDSMDLISPPGSLILVNRQETQLVNGACYVIADEHGAATYKQHRANPTRFEPVSSNKAHQIIFPDNDPVVIGRVRRTTLDL
ncbi:S24 family peptidase [Xanthobacter sediminis]